MLQGQCFSVAELASWLRVSKTSVRKAIAEGQLNASYVGRRLVIREVDIESWLAESATKAKEKAKGEAEPSDH